MTNLKKVGLTALAGSLVAVSAHAGSLSVSGGAEISYTGVESNGSGNANTVFNNNGNRFGVEKFVSFNGSGELDNGHTVSIYHGGPYGAFSSSTLTYDMGDMGTLSYQNSTGDLGIGKIDDLMPSAYEEPWDGIDFVAGSGSGVSGRVDGGQTGFNYSYSFDMATVQLGYAPKTTNDFRGDDGTVSGYHGSSNTAAAANPSSTSIAITADVADGLMVFAGMGDKGRDSTTEEFEDEHSTFGLKYTMGSITAGVQRSEIDDGAAGSSAADTETDAFGIAFAINENLTVSYGYQETEVGTGNTDQELTGYAIGYSAGGMSIKAQHNEGEDAVTVGSTSVEMERTEILVGFAF
ncbi:porin [Candidatus Pelagibacter sp.]|nr:porin [Candidatus Pelagibacter sp.]